MAAKLYLDENITPLVAQQLRRRGFDVSSAVEVGMLGKSDEEHLEYASHNSRILLTFDTGFIPLATKWTSEGSHHYGVVISKEVKMEQIGELVRLCSRLLSQVELKNMADVVLFLQQFKLGHSS